MAVRCGEDTARPSGRRAGAGLCVSDTSTLAAFERVFDTGGMSVAPTPATAAADAVTDARALTQKLSRSLGIPTATALIDQARPRPVGSALAGLFARGGLPQGEVVSLSGRAALSLALACCAETTRDGGWCAGDRTGSTSGLSDAGSGNRPVTLRLPGHPCTGLDARDVDPAGVLRRARRRSGVLRLAGTERGSPRASGTGRATLYPAEWSWEEAKGGVKERGSSFPGSSERLDSPRGILGGDG